MDKDEILKEINYLYSKEIKIKYYGEGEWIDEPDELIFE